MTLTLRLEHKFWSVFGASTLLGIFANEMIENPGLDPSVLVVEIEQTSIKYRKDHGPVEMIVPEFMPLCLMEDVLSLVKQGVDVQIRTVEIDEYPDLD